MWNTFLTAYVKCLQQAVVNGQGTVELWEIQLRVVWICQILLFFWLVSQLSVCSLFCVVFRQHLFSLSFFSLIKVCFSSVNCLKHNKLSLTTLFVCAFWAENSRWVFPSMLVWYDTALHWHLKQHPDSISLDWWGWMAEMAKVHTSFTQVEV